MTNSFAGDPSEWPVRFGHINGEGEAFVHCGGCCADLFELHSTSNTGGDAGDR
jgi:hypothetical protein